jgi:DNA repair protein RadC
MTRLGAQHVSDDVLLAVLLRSGVRGTNVVDLARRLLKRFGSLTGMARASADELAAERGMGPVKAQVLSAALEIARRLGEEATPERPAIRTPADVERLLRDEVRALDAEMFWVLLLDTKNRLKTPPVGVTKGLVDASLVHPREVFRPAIRAAAAAVVLAHNHPSGDPTPSAEDIRITRQLVDAGRLMDIRVLDHVILGRPGTGGGTGCLSLRESGVAPFP